MASTVESSLDQNESDQPQNASHDPDVTNTAQHEHSDSMVTIRLSDNRNTPDVADDRDKEKHSEEEPLHSLVHEAEAITLSANQNTPDVVNHGDNVKEEEGLLPEASQAIENLNPSSFRASRVRFNMENPGLERASSDSNTIFEADEDQQRQSQASSKSSFSAIEDGETLETEVQNHASRVRSQSSGSSSDSGSAQVDWEELDKNEELEQRDEATDEACLLFPKIPPTFWHFDSSDMVVEYRVPPRPT